MHALDPETDIAGHIWETKYRWPGDDDGGEQSLSDSWHRVARAVASVEGADRDRWTGRFLQLLADFRFLPGGRILAGAGTSRNVTLFNCFVMGIIEDDMENIFDALKEGALTMQAGGGVGYDFSSLRPKGCGAKATGNIASGPVSFMQVWDAMCATLLSTGSRRGAMIASLRCDHPDIEAFIDAKRKPGTLEHFNLSVQISDDFMRAVTADDEWPLIFPATAIAGYGGAETPVRSWPGFSKPVPCRVLRRTPARELWHRLMAAAYETAEPGVLFIDRINRLNNLAYRERITTTNPCGEIPLPPYGACNLGSINLTRFVRSPFTAKAHLDFSAIEAVAETATRFLDNVIDCSRFPLPAQAEQARGSRRIGLGMTGLADALIMLGLHYGGNAAREVAGRAMMTICHGAYRSSIRLAPEKGPFPFLDRDAYLRSGFLATMPRDIRRGIAARGIRNSHLTAIAPCGTISLLAGNVSSGIEPVYDFRVRRRILDQSGEYREFDLQDYALRLWEDRENDAKNLPDCFVTSQELPPDSQLLMQETLQRHVDNSISKTVNVPEQVAFDDFRSVYHFAYVHGLKGCTVFRPTSLRGNILTGRNSDVHCCNIEREGE